MDRAERETHTPARTYRPIFERRLCTVYTLIPAGLQ